MSSVIFRREERARYFGSEMRLSESASAKTSGIRTDHFFINRLQAALKS